MISIVSPVFRAGPIVDELVRRISAAAGSVTPDFEIILVDDASPDDSWTKIMAAADRDPRVKGILLSRNFGQQQAITAGLANTQGEYVIVMDCDLQDDPRYIPALVAKAREGFDVILTKRQRRQSWLRKACAGIFFRVFNLLTDSSRAEPGIGGYSLISRKVVESFGRIHDVHRHYNMVVSLLGFRRTVLVVEDGVRLAGSSGYTYGRLIRLALDGVTSQSTKVLRLSVAVGFAYVAAAAIAVIYLIASYWHHQSLPGWSSTVVLLLSSTGLILVSIGVLGIYIGNIFDQVRARPLYFVQGHVNFAAPPQ